MINIYMMVQQQIISLQRQWLYVALILLLTGCLGEDEPLSPIKEPDDAVFVSLGLNIGNAPSSRDYDGMSEGTREERSVQAVRLVLYDGSSSDSPVVETIDYNIKSSNGYNDKWAGTDIAPTTDRTKDNRFITKARQIERKGSYYALVIINATSAMKAATQKGKTVADFQDAQQEISAEKTSNTGGLASANNFAMTNAKGLVKVVETKYLHQTSDDAHEVPIPIDVERMVAKVTLTTRNKSTIECEQPKAAAGNLTWELDITNKHTYWLRKGAESNSADQSKWYAQDPNYSNVGKLPEADRAKQFFYWVQKDKKPTFSKTLKGSEYCLENTMSQPEQVYDNIITRVLVRCVYKPQNVAALNDGYYLIYKPDLGVSEVYSLPEMKALYEVALEEKLTGRLSKLSETVLKVTAAGYDFSTGGTPKLNGFYVTESFDTGEIRYYHKGVNYYAIKILHFGENDEPPYQHGHYGVVRNNHYTVELQTIKGPGAINLEAAEISTRSDETAAGSLYTNIDAVIKHIQQ